MSRLLIMSHSQILLTNAFWLAHLPMHARIHIQRSQCTDPTPLNTDGIWKETYLWAARNGTGGRPSRRFGLTVTAPAVCKSILERDH